MLLFSLSEDPVNSGGLVGEVFDPSARSEGRFSRGSVDHVFPIFACSAPPAAPVLGGLIDAVIVVSACPTESGSGRVRSDTVSIVSVLSSE